MLLVASELEVPDSDNLVDTAMLLVAHRSYDSQVVGSSPG